MLNNYDIADYMANNWRVPLAYYEVAPKLTPEDRLED